MEQVVLPFLRWRWHVGTGVLCVLLVSCGTKSEPPQSVKSTETVSLHQVTTSEHLPSVPEPDADAAEVKAGFQVEVMMKNLTCPTSLEFDDEGNMYVAEGGYIRAGMHLPPRILRVTPDMRIQELTTPAIFHAPITDLLWHEGRMFIAHRGKISVIEGDHVREIVSDLPSDGDHHNNQMCIGPDGKLYFGQGTASNAGVIGEDNFQMGWLKQSPQFHDVPARDIKLSGQTFLTPNPLGPEPKQAQTAAFHAFNQISTNGHIVRGAVKATGAILRMNLDGTGLEVYAWGLRNPNGIAWTPDGTLYATENGFQPRGSRPVANDRDDLYEIKQDAWYGWPDYAAGIPVTDPQFRSADDTALQFVLAEHPKVEVPVMTFPKEASTSKLLCAQNNAFMQRGMLLVACAGSTSPAADPEAASEGHRVMLLDPVTRTAENFFSKKTPEDILHRIAEARGITAGPRRLVDVVFSPDGTALYVVDFGSLIATENGPRPILHSGVIWKITSNGKLAFR